MVPFRLTANLPPLDDLHLIARSGSYRYKDRRLKLRLTCTDAKGGRHEKTADGGDCGRANDSCHAWCRLGPALLFSVHSTLLVAVFPRAVFPRGMLPAILRLRVEILRICYMWLLSDNLLAVKLLCLGIVLAVRRRSVFCAERALPGFCTRAGR